MLYQRLLKTLDSYVLMKKVLDINHLYSTELLHNLWHKVVTLQILMELEGNQYMVKNSKMKTLKLNMNNHFYYLWLTLAQILMEVNFLLHLYLVHGLTENIQFLVKLLKVKK